MSSVSVARWKVNCRHCLVKLNLGEIRIDTTRQDRKVILHCHCFLETQTGPPIRSGEELLGWSELGPEEQERVRTTISRTKTVAVPLSRASSLETTSTSPALLHQRSLSLSANSEAPPSVQLPLSASTPNRDGSFSDYLTSSFDSDTSFTIILDSPYDTDDWDTEDEDDEDLGRPPPPKAPRLSDGRVVMPDLLAGVNIPAGPARTGEECSVCLDPPVHPVTLPCGHVFCYLCAKGLTQTGTNTCSLCRKEIPAGYLHNDLVLAAASVDIPTEQIAGEESAEMTWFYEGKNGWWRFEERNREELEQAFSSGAQTLEMLICGQLYVINLVRMEQYQKNFPTRKRKIKRDVKTSQSKGVAGIQNRK